MIELAIVVPTLDERDNLPPLLARLDSVLAGIQWEVIFVDDDSADLTASVARSIARGRSNVRVIQRIGRRGLSSACVEGMLATAAPYIAVMDADMQHDEAILPRMYRLMTSEPLDTEPLDIVVGSRHVPEGSMGEMSPARKLLSRLGARISRAVCRCELSDPMSGYFMLSRPFLNLVVRQLSGVGFKILVDILASSPRPVVLKEVPYTFRQRVYGQSKLDLNTVIEYFLLLADKFLGDLLPARYVGFALVGSIGLLIYLAIVRLEFRNFGMPLVEAQAVAAFLTIIFKYLANNVTTYWDIRLRGWKLVWGFVPYCLACAFGALANISVAELLTSRGLPWYLASSLGLMIGSVWDYGVTAVLTWRTLRRRAGQRIDAAEKNDASAAG